jgi:phage shock protein A
MDDMEAEIESYDLGSQDLAEEIQNLERDEKVEKALSDLKARMKEKSE